MAPKEGLSTPDTADEEQMLAILIDTTAQLTEKVDSQMPTHLQSECRLLRMHSPRPWDSLYYIHADEGDADDQVRLFLRATLETIGSELHNLAHEMADKKQTHS